MLGQMSLASSLRRAGLAITVAACTSIFRKPRLPRTAQEGRSSDASSRKAKTFTAYGLRHARATQWAETGNLVGVAYLLGHKQVTTTNKYARPNRAAAMRVLGIVKDSAMLSWITSSGISVTLRRASHFWLEVTNCDLKHGGVRWGKAA